MAGDKARRSAGLLMFRRSIAGMQVLLAHPGGPLWARKDVGAWTIPKGLVEQGESDLVAARREFAEEMGHDAPSGEPIELGEVRLKSGKTVVGFAIAGDLDASTVHSNTFAMVWPPRSGRVQHFPEVDRAQWFAPGEALDKLNPAQADFVRRLLVALDE